MYDGPLVRLARFCYRRRRWVLLTWIVGAAAVMVVGFSFSAPADNGFSGGDTDSGRAQNLIKEHFPQQNGDTLTLAIRADGGIAAVRPRVEQVIGVLAHAPHVVSRRRTGCSRRSCSGDGSATSSASRPECR